MPHLSKTHITSFQGDIFPLRLVGEDLRHADIKWSVTGDAVELAAFTEGEYSFRDGVLLIFKKVGKSEVTAEYQGETYTAAVTVREAECASSEDELNYYIGDMHDHTSMNHNRAQFATHEYGKIEDYIDQIESEALTDIAVISDHAGVTNDYDFFRGFCLAREPEKTNVITFAGAESEIMYAEPDRFGILHRLSGEIVTINSAGYADVKTWEEFYPHFTPSPKAIAVFAHPHVVGFSSNGIWNFNFKKNNTKQLLKMVRGVEMGNGADRKENLLHEYALSAALDAGFRVSTTCSSDSHGDKWGYYIMPGKTVIMAKEKSHEAFVDALLNNRFYATESGNVKLKYKVNGKTAPADLAPTDSYTFDVTLSYFNDDPTTHPVSLKLISDYGKTLLELPVTSDSFSFTVDSSTARYFYMRLIDSEGRKTWSTPVFCGRPYDPDYTPEVTPIDMSRTRAFSNGEEIATVINGNPLDPWYSDEITPTVTIDLGEEKLISALGYYPAIILRDASKGAEWTTSMETASLVSRFTVSASTDGESYTELASCVSQNLGAEHIVEFAPTECRYIRFTVLGNVGLDSGLKQYADRKTRIANLSLFSPK